MTDKGGVVITANIYSDTALIAIVQFHLSVSRKWGRVFADNKIKRAIEGRIKNWQGPLENGHDIFDVLHDLKDSLGFDYNIVSMVVE
jgi:hypothetical protein